MPARVICRTNAQDDVGREYAMNGAGGAKEGCNAMRRRERSA